MSQWVLDVRLRARENGCSKGEREDSQEEENEREEEREISDDRLFFTFPSPDS